MGIYEMVGIERPELAPGDLAALAASYARLARAAATASADAAAATKSVAAANEGPTVDAFVNATTGHGSASDQLDLLSDAAQSTALAYRTAAVAIATGTAAMDVAAAVAVQQIRGAILRFPPDLKAYAAALQAARSRMSKLEQRMLAQVDGSFASISMPSPLTITEGESRGVVPPEIEAAWAELSDQERRDLLQLLADQHADEMGIPRAPINWDATGRGMWDGSLHLNPALLGTPELLHTAVHEMQHAWQWAVRDEYDVIASDPDRLQAILDGDVPDPMVDRYGVTTEEAARMRERNAGYVRDKGYTERPVEVDARRAGAWNTDHMTLEEFEALVDQL